MKIVIAPQRRHRDDVPDDWVEQVRTTPGVSDLVQSMSGRITVEATEDAVERLRLQLGETCHIERVILHNKQD